MLASVEKSRAQASADDLTAAARCAYRLADALVRDLEALPLEGPMQRYQQRVEALTRATSEATQALTRVIDAETCAVFLEHVAEMSLAIEDKARDSYAAAVASATDRGLDNVWTQRAAAALESLGADTAAP